MKYKNDIHGAVERLEEVSQYEGTEVGETWRSLIDVWNRAAYVSPDFQDMLEKEIIEQAEDSHVYWELVEEEQTFTRKVKELRYIG